MATKENATPAKTPAPAPLAGEKFDVSKLKVVRHVTLPIMKMNEGEPRFIKIVSPIKKGKVLETEKDKDGKPKQPVDLIDVIDLETGEPAQIVGGHVLVNTLKEDYPEDGYVGRMFSITKLPAKGSGANKYHPYSLLEVGE